MVRDYIIPPVYLSICSTVTVCALFASHVVYCSRFISYGAFQLWFTTKNGKQTTVCLCFYFSESI